MKNLRIAFFAMSLLVAVSTAFAYKGSSVCEGQLYGKVGNIETYDFAGQVAADQTLTNYTLYTPLEWRCLEEHPETCLYYVDPQGVIRQCSEGQFAEQP